MKLAGRNGRPRLHSALWSVSQQILRQALVATFTFILARKVSPAEFGLVGVAAIWNTFLHLFLELGFGAALVQRSDINPRQMSAALLLNLAGGLSLTVFSFFASGHVASLLNEPAAQPVIASLSVCFFITSAASTQIALAQRDLRFKDLALRDFTANSVAIVAGIILALANFGVWAVVISSLLLNILNALFVWRLTAFRFQLPSVADFGDVFPYGAKVFLFTGLKYFLRSIDSIAVGFLFGAERLGLYNFANRVTGAPTKALQLGLASFLFPRAAKVQDDFAKLQDLFWLSFKTLAYPMALFSLALFTVGTDMILGIFGAQWAPAIRVIHFLILAQVASVFFVPFAELLKATGQANALLAWGLLMAALTVASLLIGSLRGFDASLIALVAANWLFAVISAALLSRLFHIPWRELWSRIRIFLLISTGAAISFLLTARAFDTQLFARATGISIGGLACALAAYLLDSDVRRIVHLITLGRPSPSKRSQT